MQRPGEHGSALKTLVLRIETTGEFQASEIMADLRNVAETLFYPFRTVGYWDGPTTDHLCPQAARGEGCPHALPLTDPAYLPYARTVEDDLNGVLEVQFPHADVSIFLG